MTPPPVSDTTTDPTRLAVLQRSLENDRLGHAYLFTGEDLSLLEEAAVAWARLINCASPDRCTPCGHCRACTLTQVFGYPDVHWIRPESRMRIITIGQIRGLIRELNLKPTEGRRKIGILMAADRLSVEAANAFLKTLEEPPKGGLLILASSEPQRMLDTLLSRCLRVTFPSAGRPLLPEDQVRWIRDFSQVTARRDSGLIARYRLLTGLLGFLNQTRSAIETELEGRTPDHGADLDPKARERLEAEAKAAVEAEYRRRRAEILAGLQWWLRDLWWAASGHPNPDPAFPDLQDDIHSIARRITATKAEANLRHLEGTQRLLATNVQEALALEVGFLRLHLG